MSSVEELQAMLEEMRRELAVQTRLGADRNVTIGMLGQENEKLRESMRSILTELRNGHISPIGLRARAALDGKPPFQCKACERIAAGTAIPAREWEGNAAAPNLVSVRIIPSAWMRIVRIPSTPDQPSGEYDIEFYAGDEPPEDGNTDWVPLYRRANRE